MDKLIMYTDGGSRGNPGDSGIGIVICDQQGHIFKEISRHIGIQTNNVAEYYALVRALEEALSLGVKSVEIYMDSELVVKQINGEYRVRNEGLKPLYEIAQAYLGYFESYSVNHISRKQNKLADKLANRGMDSKNNQNI